MNIPVMQHEKELFIPILLQPLPGDPVHVFAVPVPPALGRRHAAIEIESLVDLTVCMQDPGPGDSRCADLVLSQDFSKCNKPAMLVYSNCGIWSVIWL